MPQERIVWKNKKTAELYHKKVSVESSGVADEQYIKNYLKLRSGIKVVSLGIGSGRELKWLKNFKNIKEIIGIDYSKAFLDICEKTAKNCKLKVVLVKDDLLSLKKFKNFIKGEKIPLIYICLINTLGNFSCKQREIFLKRLKKIIKKNDRLILSLYKTPQKIKTKIYLPSQIKINRGLGEKIKLGEIIEYASYELLWPSILEKYNQPPRFWYDEKNNNITMYVNKKKIWISHRFSKEEIIEMTKKVKFKIEKLIEGKFMWVVILKI